MSQFTHIIKRSNQRCFRAVWWPTADKSAGTREKIYPLMFIEGGQINRVNINNMQRITHVT